jgi:hypothetical protein
LGLAAVVVGILIISSFFMSSFYRIMISCISGVTVFFSFTGGRRHTRLFKPAIREHFLDNSWIGWLPS